jgi:tetratricopeptide (TPR) repeat protein
MSEKPQKSPQKDGQQRSYSTWYGFATREVTPQKSIRIRIRWGRVAGFFIILSLIAWFGKSWALYHFFRDVRDFEDVAFMDMVVFPMNRSNVRTQQGDYQIDQGKAALEREDYRRAFSLLREGVARSPANLEGRMLLSQIYAGWRPDLASELLVEGIEEGKSDLDYVRLMCMLLISQKEDAQVLELTESLLGEDLPTEVLQTMRVGRLQSAMMTGRFDIIRDLYEETNLARTMDGLIMGTQIYQRVGQRDLAVQILLSAIQNIPKENSEPLYNRLVSLFKEMEKYTEAREVALELVIRNPLEWRPRVALIDILSASELYERRDKEISAMVKEHRNDEQAMMALSQMAAEYGNVEAASRLYEIALENGYSLSLFSLTLAEAHVQAGNYSKAIDLCNELIEEDPAWMLTSESSFNAIRSLAYFGSGDAELGNLYLRNFLQSKRANPNQLYSAAMRFEEQGLDEQARSMFAEAFERDPKNEVILANLIQVEMRLGAFFSLEGHLKALMELRRPEYALIEKIHQSLQSDRFLYTANREQLLDDLSLILDEKSQMDWDIWERKTDG